MGKLLTGNVPQTRCFPPVRQCVVVLVTTTIVAMETVHQNVIFCNSISGPFPPIVLAEQMINTFKLKTIPADRSLVEPQRQGMLNLRNITNV